MSLAGQSGTAWVYLAGSYPLDTYGDQLILDTWSSSSGTLGEHYPMLWSIPTINSWFQVTLGFGSGTLVDRIAISLSPDAAGAWTGTMYVDDVVINPL